MQRWSGCQNCGRRVRASHIISSIISTMPKKYHEFDDPMGGFAGLLCEVRSALEAISVDDAPNDVDLPKISNMKHKCLRDGMAT